MKRKINIPLAAIMVLSLLLNMLPIQSANAAIVDYVTATRVVSEETLYLKEDKQVDVNLTIQGTPPVNVIKPNDIILLLDKSGSMSSDNRFDAMKKSASEFIDLIDFTKHTVGITDYSSKDLVNSKELSNNASELKNYISNITCGGTTETGLAIRAGMNELQKNGRSEAQPVIILLTDGAASNTSDAIAAAKEAKDAGIVFYTIALLGPNENPDTSAPNQLMKEMATTAHHHHFVLGSVGLIDIYRAIVSEIGVASAYDVKITETVAPQFEVVEGSYDSNIPKPEYDKSTNTLTWSMLELKNQSLNLGYKVRLKDGVEPGKYNVASSRIAYKDFSGKTRYYTVPNKVITVKHAPLTVESIREPKANIAGGETATIKGTNFRDGVTVKFNTVYATDVVVEDENTIKVTVPAGIQGKATVTVTNDDRTSGTLDFYYEADPEITSISPNVSEYEGGINVKINGSYFTPDAKVYFGDEELSDVKFYNSRYILVKAPRAKAEGSVDVTVENGDGTTVTVKDGFTYLPQVVEELEVYSISVESGDKDGGTRLLLKGKNIDEGAKVYFGDKEAKIVKYNATSVLLDTPSQESAGVVDVTVENLDGKTAKLEKAFTYTEKPAPKITSISPNSGMEAGGETVVIRGENFQGTAIVLFDGKEAKVTKRTGSTLIEVKAPAGTEGKVDVEVKNPDGKIATETEGYEYISEASLPVPAPEITSVGALSGKEAGKEIIFVYGKNFQNGLTVTFGDNEAELLNYYSANKIRIRVPAGTGQVTIKVTNPDGQSAECADLYEYIAPEPDPAPEITSLSADECDENGGIIIFIEGKNFKNGLVVRFGSEEAQLLNYYSAVKLRVKVPANSAGTVDVTVENPDGQSGTMSNAFTYNEATCEITKLSLTTGELAGGELVTIDGKEFENGLVVKFGDKEAQLLNYYSSSRIRVRVPAGDSEGSVDVTIENPSGKKATLSDGYTYKPAPIIPAPTLAAITSNGVLANKITEAKPYTIVFVNGTDFQSKFTINMYDASGNKVVDGLTPLNCYSAVKGRFRIPNTLAKGNYKITITNLDGQESNELDFTII